MQPLMITYPMEGEDSSIPVREQEETQVRTSGRKRGRPQKLKSYITSPKLVQGASSRKRNLASVQSSPGRSPKTQQRKSKSGTAGAQTSSSTAPPKPVIIPPITKRQKDFHASPHPGP